MFSLEQLLFAIASDSRAHSEILETVLPMITEMFERESSERDQVKVR